MRNIKLLILLCLTGTVFGGSSSHCGDLPSDFAGLLQACEALVNRTINATIYSINSYPLMGNTSLRALNCKINISMHILATGTSRMTGVDIEYIIGILNGSISPPFPYPLDCIEDELLSFDALVSNIIDNIVPGLRSIIKVSGINENSTCAQVLSTSMANFSSSDTVKDRANRTMTGVTDFTAIGQTDLYFEFFDALIGCENRTIVYALMETYNLNESIVTAFLANTSTPVGPPLSCILGTLVPALNQVNNSFNNMMNNLTGTTPAPTCEPFLSKFSRFVSDWYTFLENLQSYALNSTQTNPSLASVFIADFLCELDAMILFAANATSSMSGVDSDIVFGILNGTIASPYPAPLHCVTSQLNYMKSQISTFKTVIGPLLNQLATVSNSNTSTCSSTYAAMKNYVSIFVAWENGKLPVINKTIEAFRTTGLLDLFLDSFASIVTCGPDVIGQFVGAALHTDGAPVTAYLAGDSLTVPYPFSCVRIIINMLDSLFSQALVNIIIDSPEALNEPNVPAFRG